jgi:hypothetical protein
MAAMMDSGSRAAELRKRGNPENDNLERSIGSSLEAGHEIYDFTSVLSFFHWV